MKKSFAIILALFLVSCAQVTTPLPTETPIVKLTPTSSPVPTATMTLTPTWTPIPDLTVADVGLIWNPDEQGIIEILPCYMFTPTRFHAGDGVFYPKGMAGTRYTVYAPAAGTIVSANYLNESIGWEINVKTPYVVDGKPVFYDIVHSSGLVSGLTVGTFIHAGDKLAIKTNEYLTPTVKEWLIDIGFRNGHKQANASVNGWTGLGYFSYTKLILDDLALLSASEYKIRPMCNGNPIQQTEPYKTPTPGGFTFP